MGSNPDLAIYDYRQAFIILLITITTIIIAAKVSGLSCKHFKYINSLYFHNSFIR